MPEFKLKKRSLEERVLNLEMKVSLFEIKLKKYLEE